MNIQEQLSAIGALFTCTPGTPGQLSEHFTRIITPFLLPDGDVLDLFCREEAGTLLLTDGGETFRWLRNQWAERTLPATIRNQVPGNCQMHGIEFWHGWLRVRITEEAHIAGALMQLVQATMRVADLEFLLREKLPQASPHNEPDA
jgi:hypothetical protein